MARPKHDPDQLPTSIRILHAATAEFALLGFDHAKLEDVAASAGIRRPSLLYHFGSKAGLYEAVVEDVFARLAEAVTDPIAAPGPFEDRLRGLVLGFVEFVAENPDAAGILVRELLTPDGPGHSVIASRGAELLDAVEQWIRIEGTGSVEPDAPIRRGLLQVVSEALLRHASRASLPNIWRESEPEQSWWLVRNMLLKPAR